MISHKHRLRRRPTKNLPSVAVRAEPRQPRRHRAPEGECRYCDERRVEGSDFHPPHDASPNCQSGGRAHCTCDTCF